MGRPRSDRRFDVLRVIEKDPRVSVRELCELTGIKSSSGIWRYLRQLEAEGYITRKPGARGIYIGEHTWGGGAKKHSLSIEPMCNDSLVEKRKEAGKLGRGGGAFQAKKSKKDPGLEARIEAVVARALAKDAMGESASGVDVIRVNRSLWAVHGMRVG